MGEFASNLGCMPPLPATSGAEIPRWLELCLPLTKASESCELTAYLDTLADPPVWTVGWGATQQGIDGGTVWTQEQADADLMRRLKSHNHELTRSVRVRINPHQRAALVDFHYNVGASQFNDSTLRELLNAGDYAGAAGQFKYWLRSGNKHPPGLKVRRRRETELFQTGEWS